MTENQPFNAYKGLSESEERFRTLVTATSDVVYRMSADWKVMRQLNGGNFLLDTGEPDEHWLQKYIHPIDQQVVKDAIDEALGKKQMFRLEHRVLRADGTIGWVLSTAVPILNESGDIIEWFGTASDVSGRKATEEALRQARDEAETQRRLYEIVAANTPDLVYVFDPNYIFTFANPALLKMWGKSWDDAVGKGLLDNGYEPWHAEMHEREIDHVVKTKESIRGEIAFPHATLGKRIYDYIFSPVVNAQGEVEAIAGTTRDISDIKENEQRKNDFISMVSHELKTPLTSVISNVQVAQKRAIQNNDTIAAGMLERAGTQLGKMTRMINGFLNVSRLESGRIQIDHQLFDLSDLMKEVEDDAAATMLGHSIRIEPSPEIWINADREKISQVFNNLLSNAVKYSPLCSTIYISCSADNDFVKVCVRDEGIGVSEEDLPLIFERYYRVKGAEANHISGFGIGLYLCSEIVKLHGGSIWAESKPGEGSTFCFTLPKN
ncbi:PAS domain-containing sensor histidine kinase [Mucilaginibacter agri]|uniref:histidine kinase n=1 Tax=Mucilaginibacter agri TaxID=2695265 RepID=A0A965ZHL3_9SPHI|nr:PAS domain-containing sensor histidine kinase [Mucilaginibacter agri]NCD70273.1 PAS domain-containing protein [Mucilaginibacter agri]